ncbi:MAG: hypothetical protein LBG75_01425 [Candidatus Nomurabacteria bacterium]|jgi:hypothetical protein|nr:hypothetical protein [Candidatus Nomurabacteria bacterium]
MEKTSFEPAETKKDQKIELTEEYQRYLVDAGYGDLIDEDVIDVGAIQQIIEQEKSKNEHLNHGKGKKKLAVAVLTALMAVSVAGCADAGAEKAPVGQEQPEKEKVSQEEKDAIFKHYIFWSINPYTLTEKENEIINMDYETFMASSPEDKAYDVYIRTKSVMDTYEVVIKNKSVEYGAGAHAAEGWGETDIVDPTTIDVLTCDIDTLAQYYNQCEGLVYVMTSLIETPDDMVTDVNQANKRRGVTSVDGENINLIDEFPENIDNKAYGANSFIEDGEIQWADGGEKNGRRAMIIDTYSQSGETKTRAVYEWVNVTFSTGDGEKTIPLAQIVSRENNIPADTPFPSE